MNWRAALGGRRAAAWAVPLALVVANLVWLAAFGSGARLRDAELARRLDRLAGERARLATRLASREAVWITVQENAERLERLDRETFATESARFTDLVRELKELAGRAGLDPGTITYPRETYAEFGLSRRSFVFGVEGSYAALRTFLNLVELTPTFLVVEQIDVGESGRGLGIRLRLSTLFGTAGEPVPAATETAPAEAGAAAVEPAAAADEAGR